MRLHPPRFTRSCLVIRLLCGALLLATVSAGAQTKPLYKDPHATVEQRVQDLLPRMTLEEKVAQLQSMWFSKSKVLEPDASFSVEKATKAIPNGIGQMARPSDKMGSGKFGALRSVEDTVAFVNAVQRFHLEHTRLGIPALFHEEAAHGYMASDATIFPIPPALGSTWDPALIEQVFTVAAREARVRGATIVLSPVVDLIRDPRYGRAEEFFGEDPYLASQMTVAAVHGFQGRARPLAQDRVFATLKHFVHGVPQGGLNIAPADFSERTLRENFVPPFAAGIEAGAACVMPSYNELMGVPSHANVELLQKTGRERLGFKGAYLSDYLGISNLRTDHHIAADFDEAAILALNAGVDADLPDGAAYAKLAKLVRAGRVPEEKVDAAVARILALKFEAGLFEHPYSDAKRAVQQTNTPQSRALALRTAEKSIVLLKNDGVLPLDPNRAAKLAVIGPNAAEIMLGGYSGENDKALSVLDGLKRAKSKLQIEYAEGVRIVEKMPVTRPMIKLVAKEENDARIAEAVKLAARSDIVLLVLGDSPLITREAVAEALPGDRSTLGLFGDQDALVEAMIATGKPIVALLLNGRPLAVPRLSEKANALLEGWYLGEEAGEAVANVVFGTVNPGGKLTVSLPRSVGELPVFYNRHPTAAEKNQYVEGKPTPLYPFGFGLSYTTFDVSAPRLVKDRIARGERVGVDVDVTNTGKRAGDEVVQLYVRDDVSSVPRPVLELKAFQRVTLQPGEKRTVRFDLSPDALAFWDINMQWVVEPGTFTISAGNSSAALQSAKLTVAE